MPAPVIMLDPDGNAHPVAPEDMDAALRAGYTVESAEHGASRVGAKAEDEAYSGLGNSIDAYAAGAWRGATGGLSDVALSALGGDATKRTLRKLREHQGAASGVGEVVGGIAGLEAGGGPLGEVGGLAKGVATAPEGASAIARIGRAAAGGAIEGAAFGAGSGVSDLALSDDPVTVERAVSTLSSKMLYGGLIGGVAGGLGKGAEIGLTKAKGALDDYVSQAAQAKSPVVGDLAGLDAKGLRAAQQTELDAIEAARVPQREALADEIRSFRRDIKAQKQFLTTKDVDLPAEGDKLGAAELGRVAAKANKQLDNVLDNPAGLMKNPGKALDALQRQENALAQLQRREPELRALFAADASGERAAALDTIAPSLERNRALQAKIEALTAAPASERLTAIADAREALQTAGRGARSLPEQMATGTIQHTIANTIGAIPLPGMGALGNILGAKAANLVGEKVFGRIGAAVTESQIRAAQAVGRIFETGARAIREAPPVATAALSKVSFGRPSAEPEEQPTAAVKQPGGSRGLAPLFHQRSAELRENMTAGPDGMPQVKPAARARIAQRLQPIAVAHPILADRMETLAVKRLEFLAGKLPRRPELGGIPTGPDRWQPSDMEMRTFARYVAAVEDPDGIVERVASGAISPEDAEVMREVYPARLAELTQQVLDRLPTLRQSLPYQRRLALSILTGAPVDPSMEPRILATLQGQYQYEPDRPTPKPQFGSVSAQAEVGTKSERRERGEL